ncbi:MAG: DUF2155 domain-containing protein [Nitrospirota bacterium]
MKKVLLLVLAITVVFASWGCQKKEETPAAVQSSAPVGPIVDTQGAGGHGGMDVKTEHQVVVPPDVKELWVAVKFSVQDKKENTKKDYTVNIGEEFTIEGSGLTIKAGPFLPDFKMSGQIITSASNNLGNPAVGVMISENGKKLFPPSGEWGWLYKHFPEVHSFQHERFSLVLLDGVKK